MYTYVPACVHYTYTHTCTHEYTHKWTHAYMHTYIRVKRRSGPFTGRVASSRVRSGWVGSGHWEVFAGRIRSQVNTKTP